MVEMESIRVLGVDSDDLTHDLLTVKQSAAYYGCSIENVHKMIQAGKLDCFIDEDNTNLLPGLLLITVDHGLAIFKSVINSY